MEQHNAGKPVDEKTVVKELFKEISRTFKPIATLLTMKPSDPETLAQAAKVLTSLPPGYEHLKEKYYPPIKERLDERLQSFKKLEAAYLRGVKEKGVTFREAGEGRWRVGILLLETNPLRGAARFSFNREPLTKWTTVDGPETLQVMEKEAHALLQKSSLPQEQLLSYMWIAYKEAVVRLDDQVKGQRVYIRSVASKFLALMAEDKELAKTLNLKTDEPPLWPFLYNLDRYRLVSPSAFPAGKRLALQTGSQQEATQGHGLTINGLLPDDDYKTMCYVIPAQ